MLSRNLKFIFLLSLCYGYGYISSLGWGFIIAKAYLLYMVVLLLVVYAVVTIMNIFCPPGDPRFPNFTIL